MTDDTGKAAAAYGRRGWHTFPIWWIDAGACACGRADCSSPGKHPIGEAVPRGCLDATGDTATIRRWWERWPAANVGVATGAASGIVVLDVDPGAGGEDCLNRLMDRHGDLDRMWYVETGGGGAHLWFRRPADLIVKNSASAVGPGLDVRGEGGYVVAPPSLHRSGNRYRWAPNYNPARNECEEPPPWLLRMMTLTVVHPSGRRFPTAPPVTGPIPEGRRDNVLASLAGSVRNRGGEPNEILALLREVNKRCVPPLPDADLDRIARSIGRYPAAVPIGA